MKLVANVKDRLNISLKTLAIFFGIYIVFALVVPFIIGVLIAHENVPGTPFSGIFPSFAYSAVIGMIMVTLGFNNSVQFGSSRKTIFVSYLVNSLIISTILAILNVILTMILNNLPWVKMDPSIMSNLYKVSDVSFEMLTFVFALFLLAMSIGVLGGLLFKRLKKLTLMILGAALILSPMLFGYILSILPQSVWAKVADFLGTILGVSGPNIWAVITTLVVVCLIFNFISWLVIRRQPVK